MKQLVRIAFFVAAALVATACSSAADTATDATADATETVDESVAVETAETSAPADETTTTTTPPPNPEPVTATTVHETTSDDFPDILAAQATLTGENTWRFDVTVSSTYDTPERYADAWRVVGPDGTEFGIRVLTHDHASEQPFTRSQSGIVIPADVATVSIEGRDLANGWGGGFLEIDLS